MSSRRARGKETYEERSLEALRVDHLILTDQGNKVEINIALLQDPRCRIGKGFMIASRAGRGCVGLCDSRKVLYEPRELQFEARFVPEYACELDANREDQVRTCLELSFNRAGKEFEWQALHLCAFPFRRLMFVFNKKIFPIHGRVGGLSRRIAFRHRRQWEEELPYLAFKTERELNITFNQGLYSNLKLEFGS